MHIKTKDSAPRRDIRNNIRKSMRLIDTWVRLCNVNDKHAYLVSAGPSLPSQLARLRTISEDPNNVIFCIKHALPILIEAGITPFGVISLDPRTIEGNSTHGVPRKSLFGQIPKDTTFFLASMTHPSVTEHVLESGGKVVGWHAMSDNFLGTEALIQKFKEKGQEDSIVDLLKDYQPEDNENLLAQGHVAVTQGSCSASRGIGLVHALGFRKVTLISYDMCFDYVPDDLNAVTEKGQPKYMVFNAITSNGKKTFYTTPELAANIQDIEYILKDLTLDIEFDVWEGSGASSALWSILGPMRKRGDFGKLFLGEV
jgi:hypothetical protein